MKKICRILLIDDSPEDRADFRQMLLRASNQRYQFTEAELGSTGVQAVQGRQGDGHDDMPFDCILLDFHLPDMNAYEVLALLCNGLDLPPCPVVVVTGWQGVGDDDSAGLLRAGAQDYIGKSWTTPQSLTRTIENSIERFDLLGKRKIAQTKLFESEQRYASLFNSINEAVCIVEKVQAEPGQLLDFRYVDGNPAFTSCFGMAAEIGKTIRQLLPEPPEECLINYDSVCATGRPVRFECPYMIPGRLFELNAFRINKHESNKVAVVFNDITQRKQSETQALEQVTVLADLSSRKDEFLAMLSHELRNPLAAIFYALPLLSLHKSDDPMQLRARAIIERQAKQLNHLVDDLMEVSRITTGRVQLRQTQVTIGDIVTRAIETAQPLIAQRRHALAVSLPELPLCLSADAARLEQVVVNLLTNAAKYTDEGGRISLGVQQEGDSAVLRIRDNGIGIAPELLPCIFDLFTQAERSLDRSQGGLGIGLCLVQRLVEMHGGTVTATSTLGQGSEFVVRLPMTPALTPPPPLPLATALSPAAVKPCRVLVVDDNLDAAQALTMLLDYPGHEVHMMHDGLSALAEAVAWRPDVVLLDIELPGLNGFEVARRIRQHPLLAGMVVVAITGYGLEAARQCAREAGFDHHLTKPVSFDEIEKILAMVAEKTR